MEFLDSVRIAKIGLDLALAKAEAGYPEDGIRVDVAAIVEELSAALRVKVT